MVPLALDRLVVHPVLNRELGAETFGAFIWVLGIVSLFGNVAANGFAMLLMRDYARQEPSAAHRMFRTAMTLTIGLSMAVLPLTLLLSVAIADDSVQQRAWALYIPLGTLAVARACVLILNSILRIKRYFKTLFAMGIIEAAILLLNIAIAPTGSLWLIGFIYVLSAALLLPVGGRATRILAGTEPWNDATWRRWLMTGWAAGALITLIDQSELYVSRIVVGSLVDASEVAILYAGTAMGNLFVVPVTILAALVLSLLGGQKKFIFHGHRGIVYFGVTLLLAVAVGSCSWFFGRWLVSNRYPDLAPTTLQFYHWIAVANGCTCVKLMLRPIAFKYSSLRLTSILAASSFTVQLVLLFLSVPKFGAAGAAIALAGGAATSLVLWLFNAVFMWRAAGCDDDNSPSGVYPDDGAEL